MWETLNSRFTPAEIKQIFGISQVALVVLGVLAWRWWQGSANRSQFRVREADRADDLRTSPDRANAAKRLGDAKIKKPAAPLRLGGFSGNGAPHEILGVRPDATAEEITRAYRDLMKQYHPDRLGPPGSQAWNDGQQIAEQINRAKTALLKALKS